MRGILLAVRPGTWQQSMTGIPRKYLVPIKRRFL